MSARLVPGNYPPFPSTSTREAIARRGGGTYLLRMKLCVARTGELALVEVERTSGDFNLDTDGLIAVRAWRFQPGDRDECTTFGLHYRVNA